MKDEGGSMKAACTRAWEAVPHVPGPSALPCSFILHPSSFILRPSSFILHPSSFILRPSSFILHPSSFILRPSSFILHPSSFILLFCLLHPSIFSLASAATLHDESFDTTSGSYLAIDVTSWQWGAPSSGPGSAHSPGNCWGTKLTGNYTNNERGALLSPTFDLRAETGNVIELTWWEWLECEPYYDNAIVEVTRNGGATWELVHATSGFDGSSWQWRRIVLDDSFATDKFRFRFRFLSDESNTFAGWYVDDVKLETFAAAELFASDLEHDADLPADLIMTGAWELGTPTGSAGPATARSPVRCLGTSLDAFYGRDETSSLFFSIPVEVDVTAEKTLCVTWWQYLRLDGFGDRLSVDASYDDGSTWTNVLSTDGNGTPPRWMAQHCMITHTFTHDPEEPTRHVHLRCRLVSDDAFEQAGVYIDDLSAFEVGSQAVNQPPALVPDRDAVDLYGEIDDDEVGQPHSFDINLIASDPEDDALTWTIAAAPNHGVVSVTPSDDSARVTYAPQVNWEGTDVFYVRIADSAGLADTIRVDVEIAIVETVTDDPVDDPPTVANPIPDRNLQEDSPPVDIPLTSVFTDPDDDDAQIAKQVVANTNPVLVTTVIAGETLRLTLKPDASGSAVITVRGTSDGQSVEDEFTVTVAPVNDPPLFTLSGDVTVDEDLIDAQSVTVTPLLPPGDEQGQTVTYSLTPVSVGFADVAIDSQTGEVTITAVADGSGQQLFTVTANDGQAQNNVASETFLLTINSVNDPPTFALDRTTVNLVEDFPGTETVNAVPDAVPTDEMGQAVTYSLTPASVAFANVAINSATGQVSITAAADAFGTREFTVTADDGQSHDSTDSHSFTLTVDAVNDPPVATPQALETGEDTPLAIVLSGTDTESDPLGFAIVDPPGHGSLTGTPPNVTYTPDDNFGGTDSFTFRANDGTDDSDPGTVTVQVGDSDDPVEVANPVADVTVAEDGSPIQIDLSGVFTDPDDDDSQIVVSVLANTNSALVSTQLDAGTLTLTFAANANGSANITLRAVSGTTRVDDTFSVTVSAANDPPVNTVAPTVQGIAHPGNTLTASTGTWSDSNDQDPGQIDIALQWQRADDAQGTNLADIADATGLSYTVATGDTDTWLRARVTGTDDGEGTPVSQSLDAFTAWLEVVDLPPVLDSVGTTITVDMHEDSDPTAFDLTLSATDPDGDSIAWSVSADPQHGTVALADAGTHIDVDYTPEADWNGVDQFTVQIDDGLGGTDSVNVVVNIAAVNDPPEFALGVTAVHLDEDFPGTETVTLTPVAVPANEAGQSVTYSVSPASVSFVAIGIDPGTGEITLTAVENAYGGVVFTVAADDGEAANNAYEQTLLVNVRPVGDPGELGVSILPLATDDTTPALHGHVSVANATVRVTVEGATYTAVNNGNGTWTLADNTISPPLADGVYDVAVYAQDPGGDSGEDGTLDELTIDAVAPANAGLLSTSPGTNARTTDTSVDVTWAAASDDRSGVAGYALLVDSAADTIPPQTANYAVLPDTIDIGPTTGRRWVHLSTVDAAGNWAGVRHYGPWILGSDDVWVGPGGNNAGPGTEGEPFATIARGIDAVATGATVYVSAGNYAERVTIGKTLNLVGADRGTVCAGYGVGSGITVNAAGVTISEVAVHNYETGITVTVGGEAEVRRCSITGNTSFGINNQNAGATVEAKYNWWGDKDGPSGAGPGDSGDAVSARVDYSPWLGTEDGTTIAVELAASTDLQDAIDNTPPGGTLNIGAGTYTGDFTFTSDITIAGDAFTFDGDVVVGSGVTLDVNADVTMGSLTLAADAVLNVIDASLTVGGNTIRGTFIVRDSWGTLLITGDTTFASGSTTIWDNSHIAVFSQTANVTLTVEAGASLTIENGCLVDAMNGATQGLNYHFEIEDGATFSITDSTLKHCGTGGTAEQAGLFVNTPNAIIQRNTFTGSLYGLVLGPASTNCTVVHNYFHVNAESARDDSTAADNIWDDGTWGNAWTPTPVGWADADDNGVGDAAYAIAGTAGDADAKPLDGLASVWADDSFANEAAFYFDTLTEAMAAVSANGTVRVSAGAYPDDVTVGTTGVLLRALEDGVSVSGALALDQSIVIDVDSGAGHVLTLSGVVSGAGGIAKTGVGVLALAGENTYAGTTNVNEGTVRSDVAGAIPDASAVDLAAGTLWDLDDHSDTIASLTGAGDVQLGATTLTCGDGSTTTYSGVIDGSGGLVKTGTGTLALTGASTYTGTTWVSAGMLVVDSPGGSLATASLVVADGATLAGDGAVTGTIDVQSGGTVSPGTSPGQLTTGSATFTAGAHVVVELDGTIPGPGYDQLIVNGDVALGGATLDATLGFDPPPAGTEFVIIVNSGANPVNGTFSQGTHITIGGFPFTIDYSGGDGNDVVLIVDNPATVYVDDSFPPATPPVYMAYNAFATIQAGIDTVAAGGTVYIYTGVYAEALTIDKSFTLTRADSGQSPVLQAGGPGLGISVTAGSATVQHVAIHGFTTGIDVTGGSPTVNYCKISGNGTGVTNGTGSAIDARYNWWGDASGPSGPAGSGSGEGVSADVLYHPWWGDENGTVIYANYVPSGGSIQSTIAGATGGEVYLVANDTFVENVVINAGITLAAESGGAFTVDGNVTFNDQPIDITGSVLADDDDRWVVTCRGSIQDAVDAAEAGGPGAGNDDVILVGDGTYLLSSQIEVFIPLIILSENGHLNTVIDGNDSSRCFYLHDAPGTLVDGFTVRNGDAGAGDGGGIWLHNGTVRNCWIIGNSAAMGGGVYVESDGLLHNCVIADNTATTDGGGIYCTGSATVESCTVAGNSGSYTATTTGGGAVFADGGSVTNTIIYHNRADSAHNVRDVAGTVTFSHCCTDPLMPGTGNIDDDPVFLAIGDFELLYWIDQLASPCLDAGLNQAWMTGENDLLGNARVINGQVDMGAIECTYTGQPRAFSEPDFVNSVTAAFPSRPGPNEPFALYITVKNMGRNAGSAGWLEVAVERNPDGTWPLPGRAWERVGILQPGESRTIVFPDLIAPNYIGSSHAIRIAVDSFGETDEESEINNARVLNWQRP